MFVHGILSSDNFCDYSKQIVKGIDAITREQLVQAMAVFGFRNATPIFGMVPTLGPFKPAALLPSVTEEDKVILNNVQKVIEFLTARSSVSNNPDQVRFRHLSVPSQIIERYISGVPNVELMCGQYHITGCRCISSGSRTASCIAWNLCHGTAGDYEPAWVTSNGQNSPGCVFVNIILSFVQLCI